MKAPHHLYTTLALILATATTVKPYSNVTLTSLGGDLAVTVYLPLGAQPDDDDGNYYQSSRFDHGSMIGSVLRTSRELNVDELVIPDSDEKSMPDEMVDMDIVNTHELYGTELWKVPHNPFWPESGVGLASEFGVGDDGAFCDYRCGWYGIDNVTNGVLGYKEALPGQSFLKIGVGELIKGTCPACDSTGDYKFNSPYQFARAPVWTLTQQPTGDAVTLEHEARLKQYGYRLRKTITLQDNVLSVTSTLTNLGMDNFTTAWYSHNFFTCDATPIGPGYTVDLQIKESRPQLYEEPGLSSWSTPLRNYAKVKSFPDSIDVQMLRYVEDGTRIKAEFIKDEQTRGAFTLHGCGTSIQTDFPEMNETPRTSALSMYAFNLYIEKSTLSPEPQLLIHLESGQSTSWTQRLVFRNDEYSSLQVGGVAREQIPMLGLKSIAAQRIPSSRWVDRVNAMGGIATLLMAACLMGYMVQKWSGRRHSYTQIPEEG